MMIFASSDPLGGIITYGALLLVFFLVRPRRRTRLDTCIFWFGNISIVLVITLAILSQIYRQKNWDNVIMVDALAYVVLMLMAGVRYFGENNKIAGFGRQAGMLFGKLFLFLFLPAGLITGILVFCARVLHWAH
jgi:hypothetical protein